MNGNPCALLLSGCSIRVYRLFATFLYKYYVNIATVVFYVSPIVLTLCLMLSMTCCTGNCAGMMDGSLMATAACFVAMWDCFA